MKYLWKIGGEAGFGIMTTGLSCSMIASRSGYHVFNYNEYPSLIRGGHNTVEVLIADDEVSSSKDEVDLLVCLNKETYDNHKSRLTDGSIVLYDSDDFKIEEDIKKIHIPLKELRKEYKAAQVMANTIALGASLAIMGGDLQLFHDIIEFEFRRKGDAVVDFNNKLANAGYAYVKEHYPQYIHNIIPRTEIDKQMVLTGNDAFSLASVAADCRFYSAYPMTPSSTVLASLAKWQDKTGMVVRHAEDEISVINTALGASFAGVRSAVGTSGGGFALMVEAVSYAGVAEIPLVIFMSQRPGPATGMPTWTEQGDLLFTCHAGHGEFPKIVLAPGDVYEMVQMTTEAYDLADIYQTPVIVLSDKLLSESYTNHSKAEIDAWLSSYQPNHGKTVRETEQQPYLRYKIEEDGISERLIPGQKGIFYQANSYEHLEDSHTNESAEVRTQQFEKRNRKIKTYLSHHFKLPMIYGNTETAEVIIVSWGANKGPIRDAQRMMEKKGKKVAYIHFTHVYPMDEKGVQALFAEDMSRYVLIENNGHGQFGQLLRMQTGITIEKQILKNNGRPFYPEEIVKRIQD
jgi:2-oxoglutarate ferredoxin oxidoreductase subunit alpha